jgi:hypothetical protein
MDSYKRLCMGGSDESLRQPLMGNLWRENTIFPTEILQKLKANTGQVVKIATSQPVLLPPSEAPKRLEDRPATVPMIEFKKVN